MVQRWSRFAFIAGLCCLVAAIFGRYPDFLANFSTHVPAGYAGEAIFRGPFYGGDQVQLVYLGWKLKQALVTGSFPIYVDGYNFVVGNSYFVDMHIGIQFLSQALANFFLGPAASYNLVVIVGAFVGTYASTFFLASQITSSPWLRLAAGLGLAWLPYRCGQAMGGHGGGAVFALVPLYLGAILRHRRGFGMLRWDLVAGITLFMLVVSDEHQGYYALIMSGILFVCFWATDWLRTRNGWKSGIALISEWRWLLVMLGAVILFGLGLNLALKGDSDGASLIRSRDEIATFSHPLKDFLSGGLNIGSLWVGVAVVSLILGSVVRWSWQRNSLRAWHFLLPFLVFVLLMTGVGGDWSQRSGLYEWFAKHVPFFAYQRVPTKMSVFASVLITVIALIGLERIRPSQRSIAMPTSAGLNLAYHMAALVFMLQPLAFLQPTMTYRKFLVLDDISTGYPALVEFMKNEMGTNEKIAILPASDRMDRYAGLSQYLALRTARHFVSGYHGSAPMAVMEGLMQLSTFSDTGPSGAAVRWMRDQKVTHVILSENPSPELVQSDFRVRIESIGIFEQQICDANLCLYRVLAEQLVPERFLTYGRSGLQTYRGVPGRWMVADDVTIPGGIDRETLRQYKVATLVKLDDGVCVSSCNVQMEFGGGRNEDIWLIRAGMEPELVVMDDSLPATSEAMRAAKFTTSNGEFMLAVRDGWQPRDHGIHVWGRYGYFFTNPVVLP